MLGVTGTDVRLFLHVLAATVWVGGQLTLAGLLPALRAAGADVPATVARRFARVAWPAFWLLIGTGIWNLVAVRAQVHGAYRTTLIVKLVLVVVSGVAAFAHTRTESRAGRALAGALAGLSALGALFLGVVLAG
jgi:putative copper export protein